jgi:hypothetical protein
MVLTKKKAASKRKDQSKLIIWANGYFKIDIKIN